MTRIVHLSDLHFGTETSALCAALLRAVADLSPDLVVVSGDLTQRATPAQFDAAHAFLQQINHPLLVVPGNHDVPLYNLFLRFLRSWHRFRRAFGDDLAPVWQNDHVIVVGINSTDPFRHQKGVFRSQDLTLAENVLRGKHALRIVVTHHPLVHGDVTDKAPPRFAQNAINRLAACETDIILSGHLHLWRASPLPAVKGVRGMLQIQAGTALSSRVRGEPNDFNFLTVGAGTMTVTRYVAQDQSIFSPASHLAFRLDGQNWVSATAIEDARHGSSSG